MLNQQDSGHCSCHWYYPITCFLHSLLSSVDVACCRTVLSGTSSLLNIIQHTQSWQWKWPNEIEWVHVILMRNYCCCTDNLILGTLMFCTLYQWVVMVFTSSFFMLILQYTNHTPLLWWKWVQTENCDARKKTQNK